MPTSTELLATILFGLAIVHTFSVPIFAKIADRPGPHQGLWHLLSEVEGVFGLWATIFLVFMAATGGVSAAVEYMNARNFTEPLFVFAIMVIAASRPILDLVQRIVNYLARVLPLQTEVAQFFITLSLVPLVGSLITEPAAMTLAALMLKEGYFSRAQSVKYKYLALGVLFVNISIGGVLTAFAAPPVLIVANTFAWDSYFMLTTFGWKAAIAVIVNATIVTFVCRREIIRTARVPIHKETRIERGGVAERADKVPNSVILVHCLFLFGVVYFAHHPHIFMGMLMLFIGYCTAYNRYQNPLLIKEGLMVGFFLAGLLILGGMQQWWLQSLLAGLEPLVLFIGSTALTAITDNAALTYLGSLVEGTTPEWRYMLVAGAVTGGGLTVIANAPNPAGFALLRRSFPNQSIAAQYLLLAALAPTLVAAAMFILL
jgi:MFS family permease